MKLTQKSLAAALYVAAGAFTCQSAPLFYEGFDGLPTGLFVAPSNVGQFHLTSGSIDVIGPNSYTSLRCVSPTSFQCLDVNGLNIGGTLSSNPIVFAPGRYQLRFALIGSQRPTVTTANATVQLGAFFTPMFFDMSWDATPATHVITFNVPTQQSVVLTISTTTDGSTGLLLDSVSLDPALDVTTVPEPSFALFTGIAVLMLGVSGTMRKCLHKRFASHEIFGLRRSDWSFATQVSSIRCGFVACALAQKACRDGYWTLYMRAPAPFRDLAIARAKRQSP